MVTWWCLVGALALLLASQPARAQDRGSGEESTAVLLFMESSAATPPFTATRSLITTLPPLSSPTPTPADNGPLMPFDSVSELYVTITSTLSTATMVESVTEAILVPSVQARSTAVVRSSLTPFPTPSQSESLFFSSDESIFETIQLQPSPLVTSPEVLGSIATSATEVTPTPLPTPSQSESLVVSLEDRLFPSSAFLLQPSVVVTSEIFSTSVQERSPTEQVATPTLFSSQSLSTLVQPSTTSVEMDAETTMEFLFPEISSTVEIEQSSLSLPSSAIGSAVMGTSVSILQSSTDIMTVSRTRVLETTVLPSATDLETTATASTVFLPFVTDSETIADLSRTASAEFTFLEPTIIPTSSEDLATEISRVLSTTVTTAAVLPTSFAPTPTDFLLPFSSEPPGPIVTVVSTAPFSITLLPSLPFPPPTSSLETSDVLFGSTSSEITDIFPTSSPILSTMESPTVTPSPLPPSPSRTSPTVTPSPLPPSPSRTSPSDTPTLTSLSADITSQPVTLETIPRSSILPTNLLVPFSSEPPGPIATVVSTIPLPSPFQPFPSTTSMLQLPTSIEEIPMTTLPFMESPVLMTSTRLLLELSSETALITDQLQPSLTLPAVLPSSASTFTLPSLSPIPTTTTVVSRVFTSEDLLMPSVSVRTVEASTPLPSPSQSQPLVVSSEEGAPSLLLRPSSTAMTESTEFLLLPSVLPTMVPASTTALPSRTLSPSPSLSTPPPFSPLSEALTTDLLLPLTTTAESRPETSTAFVLETSTAFLLPEITTGLPLSTDILLPLSETPQPTSSVISQSSISQPPMSSMLPPLQPMTTITLPQSTATFVPSVPSLPTVTPSPSRIEVSTPAFVTPITTLQPSPSIPISPSGTATSSSIVSFLPFSLISTTFPLISSSPLPPETTVIAIESSVLLPLPSETPTTSALSTTTTTPVSISPSQPQATSSTLNDTMVLETSTAFITPSASTLQPFLLPTSSPSLLVQLSQTGQATSPQPTLTTSTPSLEITATSSPVSSTPLLPDTSSTVLVEITTSVLLPELITETILLPFTELPTPTFSTESLPMPIISTPFIQSTAVLVPPRSLLQLTSSFSLPALSSVVPTSTTAPRPQTMVTTAPTRITTPAILATPSILPPSRITIEPSSTETSSVELLIPIATTTVEQVSSSPSQPSSTVAPVQSSSIVVETSSVELLIPIATTTVEQVPSFLIQPSSTAIPSATLVQETSSVELLIPIATTTVEQVSSSPSQPSSTVAPVQSSSVAVETSSVELLIPFATTTVEQVSSFLIQPSSTAIPSATLVQETSSVELRIPIATTTVEQVSSSPSQPSSTVAPVQSSSVAVETSSVELLIPFATTTVEQVSSFLIQPSSTAIPSATLVQETSSVELRIPIATTTVEQVSSSPSQPSSTVAPVQSSSVAVETSSVELLIPFATTTAEQVPSSLVQPSTVAPVQSSSVVVETSSVELLMPITTTTVEPLSSSPSRLSPTSSVATVTSSPVEPSISTRATQPTTVQLPSSILLSSSFPLPSSSSQSVQTLPLPSVSSQQALGSMLLPSTSIQPSFSLLLASTPSPSPIPSSTLFLDSTSLEVFSPTLFTSSLPITIFGSLSSIVQTSLGIFTTGELLPFTSLPPTASRIVLTATASTSTPTFISVSAVSPSMMSAAVSPSMMSAAVSPSFTTTASSASPSVVMTTLTGFPSASIVSLPTPSRTSEPSLPSTSPQPQTSIPLDTSSEVISTSVTRSTPAASTVTSSTPTVATVPSPLTTSAASTVTSSSPTVATVPSPLTTSTASTVASSSPTVATVPSPLTTSAASTVTSSTPTVATVPSPLTTSAASTSSSAAVDTSTSISPTPPLTSRGTTTPSSPITAPPSPASSQTTPAVETSVSPTSTPSLTITPSTSIATPPTISTSSAVGSSETTSVSITTTASSAVLSSETVVSVSTSPAISAVAPASISSLVTSSLTASISTGGSSTSSQTLPVPTPSSLQPSTSTILTSSLLQPSTSSTEAPPPTSTSSQTTPAGVPTPSPLQPSTSTILPSSPLQPSTSSTEAPPPTSTSQPSTSTILPSSPLQPSTNSTEAPPPTSTSQPSTSTILPSSPLQPSTSSTEAPPPTSTPSPPPPTADDFLVDIRLAFTSEEHEDILQVGSPRRRSLEEALAVRFAEGLRILQSQRTQKRQTVEESYVAVIQEVGPLINSGSVISFYVGNGTADNPIQPPLVIDAFNAVNDTNKIGSYPVLSPPSISTPTPTEASSTSAYVIGGVVGGVVLFVTMVLFVLCLWAIWYHKKRSTKIDSLQLGEAGVFCNRGTGEEDASFEFITHSIGIQHGSPVVARATRDTKRPRISISHLAHDHDTRMERMRPQSRDLPRPSSSERPESQPDRVPAALFERVAHYDTPQPSPPIRTLRMRFRSSVAPSPSTSHKSQSLEQLQKSSPPPVAREGVEVRSVRENALRLQEEREEQEIRARKKATLERLLLRSRQTELCSRGSSRRKKKRTPSELRPSTYSGPRALSRMEGGGEERRGTRREREVEVEAALGDVESSTPGATPPHDLPASPRPNTRRRWVRKKLNRVGPMEETDDYDSTDQPYHRMPVSRQSRGGKFKVGRNQRARPFARLSTTGRLSRGIAHDVQQELAWMDTGSGVQLMRIQPVQPILGAPPPPQYPYSHHPQAIRVQPRPHAIRPAWEELPTLTPLHSQSYTQRQLESYLQIHQEMEQLQLDHSNFPTAYPTPAHSTPAHSTPAHPTPDYTHHPHPSTHTLEQQQPVGGSPTSQPPPEGVRGEGGGEEPPVQGVRGEGGEQPAEKTETKQEPTAEPPVLTEGHPSVDRPPSQTPLGSASMLNLDSSYSVQDLMQQVFSSLPRGSRERMPREEDPPPILLPGQQHYGAPPPVAWHAVPQAVYGPPHYPLPTTHYTLQPFQRLPEGQLVWTPDATLVQPMPPFQSQLLTPAQLTQLRSSPNIGYHDNTPASYEHWVDPFHTPQYSMPSHSHVRTRMRHHDAFL